METNYNFSVFKAPIQNTNPLKNTSLKDVYSVIVSTKYQLTTEAIRQTNDKATISSVKASELDYVTFSGTFSKRSVSGLKQHSNLFCIDLDNLKNVAEVKDRIVESLPPSLMFVSPSGNGLKIVYKIDTNEAEHLQYYKSFEYYFKEELNVDIDDKCKDIPRACYLCYDKDAYYNNEAPTLDHSFIDTFTNEIEYTIINDTITDYDEIIKNLKVWLDKKESFIEGNRNSYITQLSGAYNRYGIPQQIAESDLLNYVQNDFKASEIKATIKSIYNNTTYHNTASFEISNPYVFNTSQAEVKEPERTPLLPIEGFPEPIQNFINEYTTVYKTPRDYIAASVMFSTAFAVGDKIELKGKYDNIPLLWMAIVGNVSSGKTDPLKTGLSYFENKDKEAFKEYNLKMAEFNAYEKLNKKDKEHNDAVTQPSYYQYLLNDYTPEALYNVHSVNNRGLCIYRDELKGWFDDFGRYSSSGEQSTMLSTFYQQPMQINRASKEPINIPKPCIYVSGGIQPDILPDLAKDSRAENGFLARLIFVYPELQDKQYYSSNKLNKETLVDYHNYLNKLATIKETIEITLSDEAETIYGEWYNKNVDITNEEPQGYLKGVYGKLDVISLRLAIVIHAMNRACNNDSSNILTEQSMQTAIDLTEYFRTTALKVYSNIFKDSKLKPLEITTKDVAKYCTKLGASQTKIAGALKISQQAVNKLLK
jgi:hypothetical protein